MPSVLCESCHLQLVLVQQSISVLVSLMSLLDWGWIRSTLQGGGLQGLQQGLEGGGERGGGGGGVKSVISASAVTCPTRQCMMSICSRF